MIAIVVILTGVCAVMAIRASRVLIAILWLALVSVMTSILLYLAGAWLIAVIELSIGTGLATVLMVFVITMIGDEQESIPPRPWHLSFVLATIVLICTVSLPLATGTMEVIPAAIVAPREAVQTILWDERGLDILPQIALIFVGVIGVLALLIDSNIAEDTSSKQTHNIAPAELMPSKSQTLVEQEAA